MHYANTCTGKGCRLSHRPREHMASSETCDTLQPMREILPEIRAKHWEPVPFPLHIDLDFVYNIDKNLGVLTITESKTINSFLSRLVRQTKIATIQDPSVDTLDTALVLQVGE